MDEGLVTIPKVGEVRAKAGFSVVATQNPREFTATHSLSEALLDRFEMVTLDYQTKEEEAERGGGGGPRASQATSSRKELLARIHLDARLYCMHASSCAMWPLTTLMAACTSSLASRSAASRGPPCAGASWRTSVSRLHGAITGLYTGRSSEPF